MSMSPPIRLSASILALAAALGGCTTVGPDFERPAPPATPGYVMTGETGTPRAALTPEARPAGVWWAALGSAELDRVIRQALKDSPTLAEADATLARNQAQADAVRGSRRPQADLNASLTRERINTTRFGISNFPSPTATLYSVGGSVSYDLDVWGAGRRRVEQAEARAEAQGRRADAAYLSLTGEVALQAVEIAALRAEIAAAQATVEDDRRLNDIVSKGIKAGGEAPPALASGEAQLAQDEAVLPPLLRQLDAARHRLALLAGQAPGAWAAPEFELNSFAVPGAIPVNVPSSLVRQRPDILAAEAELHAATADVGVQTAALYPDISLSATLAQTARSPEDLFGYSASGWDIGGMLTAPLLRGGTLKANRRAAEAEARAAMARYQQAVLVAFVQVADSLQALARDEEAIGALARSEAADAENVRLAEASYRLGGGPLFRVIDARRQLSRSQRERVRAEGQRLQDVVRLYAATAGGWTDTPRAISPAGGS
jgi:NodT family efflux transporter outer membrane factor (OMF) lipoprotein